MTIVETIQHELAEFNKMKVALTETLRKQFPALLTPLFEANPGINNISWSQFTPYFNDGESCEFSVHNSDILINNQYSWDSEIDGEVYRQFNDVLQSVPDEFYLEVFGDHIEITINKDASLDIIIYDHD